MVVWVPETSAVSSVGGWLMEVPARAPGLPINLWLHWSGLCRTATGLPAGDVTGEWRRETLTVAFMNLAVGDIALTGQASVGLADVWREKEGVFDSDHWGASAADWVDPLRSPVVGPAVVAFTGQCAVLGRCAVVGVSLTIDLLVLRPSLIPEVPPVHGTRARRPTIPGGSSTTTLEGPGRGIREALRAQLAGMKATLDADDVDEPVLRSAEVRPLAAPSMRRATVEVRAG